VALRGISVALGGLLGGVLVMLGGVCDIGAYDTEGTGR
jgi:hypothetical protein